jgi:hypothetical protein
MEGQMICVHAEIIERRYVDIKSEREASDALTVG